VKRLTARDVMTADVLCVREDLTVRELAAFLGENQITGAPVIDAAGRLVGMVSVTDVAESDVERPELGGDRCDALQLERSWAEHMEPGELRSFHIEGDDLLVRDIMTPAVYAAPENTPVATLARTMVAGRIHRLLVTRGGRVCGIVTSLDLLRLLVPDTPARDAAAASLAAPRVLRR
jgi:CBS domain-containing protein